MARPLVVPLLALASAAAAAAPRLAFPGFTAGFQGLMQRTPQNGVLAPGAATMPGEAAQLLAASNFLRDNVLWSAVETEEGRYNFSHTDALLAEYDALVASVEAQNATIVADCQASVREQLASLREQLAVSERALASWDGAMYQLNAMSKEEGEQQGRRGPRAWW
jgi:hypothetical protein